MDEMWARNENEKQDGWKWPKNELIRGIVHQKNKRFLNFRAVKTAGILQDLYEKSTRTSLGDSIKNGFHKEASIISRSS